MYKCLHDCIGFGHDLQLGQRILFVSLLLQKPKMWRGGDHIKNVYPNDFKSSHIYTKNVDDE